MKKVLFLLALMLTISTAKAQDELPEIPYVDESTHMKFMGIPMDCDAETFSKRLEKEKGFIRGKYLETDKPTLKGTFSGYSDCIFVLLGEDGSNIKNVAVIMPIQNKFSFLVSQYQTLKSRLIIKYGKPDTEEEGFRDYEFKVTEIELEYAKQFDIKQLNIMSREELGKYEPTHIVNYYNINGELLFKHLEYIGKHRKISEENDGQYFRPDVFRL